MDTLHEDVCIFMTIPRWILGMSNISDKSRRENQNTLFFREDRVEYEIMWKNILEPGRPQMKTWRMRITC